MPSTKRPDPLYQRGEFRLYRRPDRSKLEIVWYDSKRRRERSRSAGTNDDAEGRIALDRLYLESEGQKTCPTCGRPFDGNGSQLLTAAIADYLILSEAKPSYPAITSRLAQAVTYTIEKDAAVTCAQIDEAWIDRFRAWLKKRPIISPKKKHVRQRSIATIEATVAQLAAVINQTQSARARFKPIPLATVNKTPLYRADVKTLAAMFGYAMGADNRINLLRFLRASVATWARPDAVMDIDTTAARRQWITEARVLALNPHGRRQTKKYRATVPVPHQFAQHLDATKGPYIPINSIRSAWENMADELKLPKDREAGQKLIRRSISHLARKRLGEEHWIQGEIMLGHHKLSTSDVYALPDPANLGRALAATEAIIDEIEKKAPGAFYRNLTAKSGKIVSITKAKK